MENNHILVIEGIREAHKHLLETNSTVSWVTDANRLRDRNGYFHKIGIDTKASVDDWLYWIRSLNNYKKIDSIVNFSEKNQEKTAIISQDLGLDYHSIDTIRTVNDKSKMREVLNEPIKYRRVNQLSDLLNFYDETKKPLILKPLNGTGSDSVYLIKSKANAKTIVHENNINFNNRIYVAEEYLRGKEYSLEVFSYKGSHALIAVTEKFLGDNFVEVGHCVPAPISEDTYEILKNYTFNILNQLNVKNGITHTEVIYDGCTPTIIETHLRAGGDQIVDLTKNALGVDMFKLWVNSIINNNVTLPELKQSHLNPDKYSAIYYVYSAKRGVIKNISVDDECDKDINEIKVFKSIGDEVRPMQKSRDRLGYAIVTTSSYDTTIKKVKDAINKIKIDIEMP